MYLSLVLYKTIEVTPTCLQLNADPRGYAVDQLRRLEGTCVDPTKYVVEIEHIMSIGKGKIAEGTANVRYPMRFEAQIFEPVLNGIVEAKVFSVEDYGTGLYARCGPLVVFVPSYFMPAHITFENDGFQSKATGETIGVNSFIHVRLTEYACHEDNEMMWVGQVVYPFC
jgi:DNA-directed RNA polymerase subunit E'/Rpb7